MFEYDPIKSAANLAKHGIDFEAAQALWDDDFRLVVAARLLTEARTLVIGRIGSAVWTAVITERGDANRIISVRHARKEEVQAYDVQNP